MTQKIRIVQIGLGPIGLEITRILAQRERANIVAAIDVDPEKQGKTLGELAGVASLSVPITSHMEDTLRTVPADIAIVSTSSYIKVMHDQLAQILPFGLPVVTTCEELAFPQNINPALTDKIDTLAKKHKAAVLATGVNPGFLMDFLPMVASSVCADITAIKVERIQDAATRRIPFQRKIGAGLSVQEYHDRVAAGTLRHMGLKESAYLLAAKLGWSVDNVDETIEPVIKKSIVAGTRQVATATHNGQTLIELIFQASMEQEAPKDTITVTGKPSFSLSFTPTIQGDIATAAIIVNAIPGVLSATPGLKTMVDMSGMSYWV